MSSKEKFYEELAAHFTKEEQDSIKEKCSSMEMELPAFYDSESFYKWISHNFNSERFGYHKCMQVLEGNRTTLAYSSYIEDTTVP
ncbi:hypothetical protein [Phocaeicola coprocola]|uniref:hypothetical protein n=1 Tax=Phocaeicola coprocola TaxID=310298 RepID=UPI003FF12067